MPSLDMNALKVSFDTYIDQIYIKRKVTEKLVELDAYVDKELSDYIMVMVANKKSPEKMTEDLGLFLGDDAENFTSWLQTQLDASKENSHRKSKNDSTKRKRDVIRSRSRSPMKRNQEILEPELDIAGSISNEFDIEEIPKETAKEERKIVSSVSIRSHEKPEPIHSIITKPLKSKSKTTFDITKSAGAMLRKAVLEARESINSKDAEHDVLTSCFNIVKPSAIVAGTKKSTRSNHSDDFEEDRRVFSSDKRDIRSRLGIPQLEQALRKDYETHTTTRSLAKRLGARKAPLFVNLKESLSDEDELESSSYTKKINAKIVGNGESDEMPSSPTKAIPEHLERCKYWPKCRNKVSCPYMHPTEQCKQFPNCKYNAYNCMFIHPSCKYDLTCQRPDCKFQHSKPANLGLASGNFNFTAVTQAAAAMSAVAAAQQANRFGPTGSALCKFHPFCNNAVCTFLHPAKAVTRTPQTVAPCRYGPECRNQPRCVFSHLPPVEKLKWTKPTVPSEATSSSSLPTLAATIG